MYYKLKIDETGRNTLREEAVYFDTIIETLETIEDVKEYIIDRYGRIPNGKNKIYRDDKNGNPQEVGFLHSFWNSDVSHDSKKWYQTDWVCVSEVIESPISCIIH